MMRPPSMIALAALGCAATAAPTPAQAMCDVIPGVVQEFRGAVGTVNRPFAIPNDDGEEILVRVRPGACDSGSPGFVDRDGDGAAVDDYFVTVLFEPPGGGIRNAVVLGTSRSLCDERIAAVSPLPSSVVANCVDAVPERDLSIRRECVGGGSSGKRCTDESQCPGGSCEPVVLRFRFPDTDATLSDPADDATRNDDRTFTGPATIAVTPVVDENGLPAPLPFSLAIARCAETPGLVACIDELYARDGTCETGADHLHSTFGHFTALPPPNDYQALCETPNTPCTGLQDEVRFTVDADGNALIPMDYRGVLVQSDRIPIPRLILGKTGLEAFSGGGAAVDLPSDAFLASYAPGGQKLPPIFTPLDAPQAPGALSLFGSVDAPVGVIRVQRRGCVGGPSEGQVCSAAAECDGGACQTLFDFSDRLAGAVGPVLIERASDETFGFEAQNPVPLDGLIESESMFAFVSNEAIGEPQDDCDGDGTPDCTRLNDDSDATDPVLGLRDRTTGRVLPIGTNGAEGRAVVRVRDGRFRYLAVVAEGDLVAFLESEPLEGDCADAARCDANGNGSVFDSILRVFRVNRDCADFGPCDPIDHLTDGLDLGVDAARRVAGATIAISDGLVYFRTPEWLNAPIQMEVASGTPGNQGSSSPVLSADGRFVGFDSCSDNLVANDESGHCDVFVRDRLGRIERVSVSSPPTRVEGNAFSSSPALSSDGRFVAFTSEADNLVSDDTNDDNPFQGMDSFVHDRSTAATERVSVASTEVEGNSGSFSLAPALSGDGRFVAFTSLASNLEAGDENARSDVFVRDRGAGETRRISRVFDDVRTDPAAGFVAWLPAISTDGRIVAYNAFSRVVAFDRATAQTEDVSVAADGSSGNLYSTSPSVSADGRFVAFLSLANNLVPGDTNDQQDVFVRDRLLGHTERVSVASDGRQAQGDGLDPPSISADGRFVAFQSQANDLVPDDTNRIPLGNDIFLHDRLTGATTRVTVGADLSTGLVGSYSPWVSGDGRFVAFASDLRFTPQTGGGYLHAFIRGPALAGDDELHDTVLEVLDATRSPVQRRTLGPAEDVTVAAGSAAFLAPQEGGPGRVHLSVGGNPPQDLFKDAVSIAMSEKLLAARVPASDGGDALVEVTPWPDCPRCWRPLESRATAIEAAGWVVALLAPECSMPGCAPDNGDGDVADRLVRIYRADRTGGDALVETLQAAEDLVLGERLVAFHTREETQGPGTPGCLPSSPPGGCDLNGDGDDADDVLQVFDLDSVRLFNTEQAVTPCPLEACDPRFPYRVSGDTVTFITSECEQGGPVRDGCPGGGSDLNGDGDARDLVKQVFNAREAAALAATSHGIGLVAAAAASTPVAAGGSVDAVAGASAGICTTTGAACATADECGGGSCYLPPGGCIATRPRSCTCTPGGCVGCLDAEFCEPFANGGGSGVCKERLGSCANQLDCDELGGEECRDATADIQRLLSPIAATGTGEAVSSSGTCVERRATACTRDEDCQPELCPGCGTGDRCGTAGTCERHHGSCRTADDCAEGLACAPNLVTVAAADSDADQLADPFDNCPERPNPKQTDQDGDGVGDCCDLSGPDADSDGAPDPMDNCRELPNPDQRDSDSDGFGNACDLDHTNDGVVDGSDLGRVVAAFASRSGSERYDASLDVDGDGVIGGPDLVALGRSFGGAPGPSARLCSGPIASSR